MREPQFQEQVALYKRRENLELIAAWAPPRVTPAEDRPLRRSLRRPSAARPLAHGPRGAVPGAEPDGLPDPGPGQRTQSVARPVEPSPSTEADDLHRAVLHRGRGDDGAGRAAG